jgi:uncharacterized protein
MTSDAMDPRPKVQLAPALAAGLALIAGALALGAGGWRQGALFALGGLLGLTLYHGMFGFTSAYRNAMLHRDVSSVKAQLVMIWLASLLFVPTIAAGEVFGTPVGGAVAPVGLQVAVGSLLFGLGMQLAGGCGSGTLYTLGGGSSRMVLTLLAFCAGGFLASLDMERWAATPRWGSITLIEEFGWPGALALQTLLVALLWAGLNGWAAGAGQRSLWGQPITWQHFVAGPWPLLFTAALLALLNWLTLLVAGHPWSITWAFTLWSAKLAAGLGWDPATSAFWSSGFPARALSRSLWQDTTSIMNFGIVLGALGAAGLAGRFAPSANIPLRTLLAAALGGLLMGYGARIAFGCNIGAFFSGAASTSLHGWLWILFALAGTWLGVRLRPHFGLQN